MASIKQSEYEALASFRYALRQFLHFSEEAARSLGITPKQHQALLAIKGFSSHGKVSVGELAERLQIRHHSAVELVNRMTADGFVVREGSAKDRRQVYVHLTERGSEILENLSAAHKRELRRLGPKLKEWLVILSNHK
ncbi:MAG TPA: MarR family transcriptional regulator [Anaerolineales bacterium]|nr:MarR family transcriptional regulator [Anaerolineales bacterium]